MANRYGTYDILDGHVGDTIGPIVFTYKTGTPATVKDLSNFTITGSMRERSKDGTQKLALSEGSGITVTDAANGEFQIDDFSTAGWNPELYYYNIRLQDDSSAGGGAVVARIVGTMNLLERVE